MPDAAIGLSVSNAQGTRFVVLPLDGLRVQLRGQNRMNAELHTCPVPSMGNPDRASGSATAKKLGLVATDSLPVAQGLQASSAPHPEASG